MANKSNHHHLNNNIWLFPFEFYNKEIASLVIDQTNTNAPQKGKNYLVNAGAFPTFLTFSGKELISLANSFQQKNTPFQLACEEWCNQCYNGGGSNYFFETILPLLPTFQSTFDKDDFVNFKQNTTERKFLVTIFIGEISPLYVWNYYKKYLENMQPEIDALINEYTETGNEYTIPVFIFKDGIYLSKHDSNVVAKMEDELLKSDETEEEVEPISQKKYFDIDDL